MAAEVQRARELAAGVRFEIITVAWMVVEAVVSIGAGIVAHSFLLTAFGLDSLIELVSGGILLWRLSLDSRGEEVERVERAEHRAEWFVAVSLGLLCLYVLGTAIFGLAARSRPDSSPAGILVSLVAVIVMPYLGVSKRRVAARIESDALKGDAAESFTCAYMAGTVLVGLVLDALLHWWWAEDLAALGFLFWLAGETREALEDARERGGVED
jgi:divalent metal cation (Fe/Co/Zn/Cd) transporter